jgi:hypothetical protein
MCMIDKVGRMNRIILRILADPVREANPVVLFA